MGKNTASAKVPLEPRVSGNKVIIPLEHLSHRERRACESLARTKLGRYARRVVLNDEHELVCQVTVTSSRRRDTAVQSVLYRACSAVREAVTMHRKEQAWRQRASERKVGNRQLKPAYQN